MIHVHIQRFWRWKLSIVQWTMFIIFCNKFSFVVFRVYKCLLRNKNPNSRANIPKIHFFWKWLHPMISMSEQVFYRKEHEEEDWGQALSKTISGPQKRVQLKCIRQLWHFISHCSVCQCPWLCRKFEPLWKLHKQGSSIHTKSWPKWFIETMTDKNLNINGSYCRLLKYLCQHTK